jgi:hypothetical protein
MDAILATIFDGVQAPLRRGADSTTIVVIFVG